jgi:glucose-1-phosphate thymidylyltransferase
MVDTNTKVLGFLKDSKDLVSARLKSTNSVVIPPCFIGDDVTLVNSVIGPYVSIEKGSTVTNSVVRSSILRGGVRVQDAVIDNSMLGERAAVTGHALDLSLGDDSKIG